MFDLNLRTQSANTDSSKWLSEALKTVTLCAFLLTDLALVVVLLALTIRSSTHDGFATIATQTTVLGGVSWDLGILWTALPTLVFRLFGMFWDWISSALSDRQPYVDLYQNGGASATTSILLDYRTIPLLWRWWKAFKNKHTLVGISGLLSLVVSVGVTALSARLFAAQSVLLETPSQILFNSSYTDQGLNFTLDWVPIFDTVAAVNVYGGEPQPWTNNQYAFRPFYPTSDLPRNSEVRAETTAYSAYLNCSNVPDPELNYRDTGVTVSATDRGCDVSTSFAISSTQEVYFKVDSEISCSAQAWYSRLLFVAGKYSNSSSSNQLSDVSVISCITGYRATTGNLIVLEENSSAPSIKEFTPSGTPDTTRNVLWRVFEQGIVKPASVNPTTIWSTSAFGTLILYYAQEIGGDAYLSTASLLQAIPQMFTAVYLTATAEASFTASQPEESTGYSRVPTSRLFVVPWASYTIVVLLLLAAIVAVFILFHVRSHQSILTEEPSGLLSYAGILEGSPLLETAAKIRQSTSYDGKLTHRAIETDGIANTRWLADNQKTVRPVIRKLQAEENASMATSVDQHTSAPVTPPEQHGFVATEGAKWGQARELA